MTGHMLRATLGAALLGVVLADAAYAVLTGGLPVYRLPVPWGAVMGVLLAILALRPALPAQRAACLLGMNFVFMAAAVPSSVTHHKIRVAGITLLFGMAGALLSIDDSRESVPVFVVTALGAALLRGLMLSS